jgi:uncharacterized RDD family membrane protein YckC
MSTPLDKIQHERPLQQHWLRRTVAFIIDVIIIAIVYWIIFTVIFWGWFFGVPFFWFGGWFFMTGFIFFLYTGIMEGTGGATFGKLFIKLKVTHSSGKMDIGKGMIRSISKLFWPLLFLDVLIGFVTNGDPRQRYLDRMTETLVIDVQQHN